MATGRTPQPVDAPWVWIQPNQLDIQSLGEFAVKEQNKRHCSNLIFNNVYESWNMILASDSGDLYLLHLKALKDDSGRDFQAIVWVRPKGCVSTGCEDARTLVSFKELSPAA